MISIFTANTCLVVDRPTWYHAWDAALSLSHSHSLTLRLSGNWVTHKYCLRFGQFVHAYHLVHT